MGRAYMGAPFFIFLRYEVAIMDFDGGEFANCAQIAIFVLCLG
jgi:hypothetical protein